MAALAGFLSLPARARPEEASTVTVDWKTDGAITGIALGLWFGSELEKEQLAPPTCRWCTPPRVDTWARGHLLWSNPRAASTATDVLVVAVPLGLAVYSAVEVGDAGRAGPDLLVMTESIALAGLIGQTTKFLAVRQRPYALYGTGPSEGADDRLSFYSGHTTIAFAAAASAGRLAQLRGDEHWPWVYGIGLTTAAATGWLRVAGDKHWLTDVLAGAAAGTAVGLVVPSIHRSRSASPSVGLSVAPTFIAVSGTFW